MALPSSGQLTIAQISDEFGGGSRSNVSLRALSSTAGLSQPDQFSDFYGLSAYTAPTYASVSGASNLSISGSGTPSSPFSWSASGIPTSAPYTFYEHSYYCGSMNASFYVTQYSNSVSLRFTSNYDGEQRVTIDLTTANAYGTGPLCINTPGDTYSRARHSCGSASQTTYRYSNGSFSVPNDAPAQLRNLGPVSGTLTIPAGSTITYNFNGRCQTEAYGDNNWGVSALAGTIYFEPV